MQKLTILFTTVVLLSGPAPAARAAEVFAQGAGNGAKSEEELTVPLYEQIGRLKVEVDWLKKKL